MKTLRPEDLPLLSPKGAVELLRRGNERFLARVSENPSLQKEIEKTKEKQSPFAFVLSCIDSRVPIEIIFDQDFGDVLVCRIAGNIVNEDILGSAEFAVQVVGVKVVFVLGHTSCGAIKGAIQDLQLGHLTGLVSKIKPAVYKAQKRSDLTYACLEDSIAHVNVEETLSQLYYRSVILRQHVDSGKILLQGGMYDIRSGRVEFLACDVPT
ncbi:MAG: carbonic anhydrase [Bacteroidia bacterium]